MAEAGAKPVTERLFPSMDALAPALAGEISRRLGLAVRERGVASLVATGGSTPGPVYDALSRINLPWERVFVTLSDERWVDPEDAASNERLVRTRLLRDHAAGARFVGLKTGDESAAAAMTVVGNAIATLPRPFDAVLLGMGDDGHVASLFAHDPAHSLETPGDVCAVQRKGAAGSEQRMSLTFMALRDARWTALLIKGDEKQAVIRQAQVSDYVSELPVSGILKAPSGEVEIWWTS
jgi:6-phosphogluconolactonase